MEAHRDSSLHAAHAPNVIHAPNISQLLWGKGKRGRPLQYWYDAMKWIAYIRSHGPVPPKRRGGTGNLSRSLLAMRILTAWGVCCSL